MSDAVPRRVRQRTPSLQAALLTHTCSSPCRSNTPFPTRLIPNETPPAQARRHNDCGGDQSPDERQHHRTHGVRAECTAATTPQLGCAAGCTVGVSRWEWARGVGTRFWMSLREMRGASEGLRGHSVRRTSSSHDHRVLRDQLLGLVPILALSLPTSPTTCIVRTGAVSARGGRPRPTEGRSLAGNPSVHAWRVPRRPERLQSRSGRVYRAELGPPLAERRRAFRILFSPPAQRRGLPTRRYSIIFKFWGPLLFTPPSAVDPSPF